ncbi:MAG: glycosyltransferase family 39 protein [Lysobacteraceae bacterium]
MTNAIRRDQWILLFAVLLVIGAGIGLRDPWPADEPRFALVARQMVDTGLWLFPQRGNELYADKPPLFMWLQAIAYLFTRSWRIAFLLPSLLAAIGAVVCVYDLGRRLWSHKIGLYAAYGLLFALQFTYQMKKAQIDPLVTFWITLANYGLIRHVLHGPNWRWWILGWFAAGLGVITKGVGVLAILMLLPAAYASLQGWPGVRLHVRDPKFWLGPVFLLLAIALWLVPMLLAVHASGDPAHAAYAHDILFHQTAQRYAESWDHQQPWWYQLTVMLMWAPLILALPWAIPAWATRLRRRDPRYLLPLAWWLLIVVFFSIPHGKRDMYIMPALPMAALAFAPLLPGLLRKPGPRAIALLFGTALTLLLLIAGLGIVEGNPHLLKRLMQGRGIDLGHARAIGGMLAAMGAWSAAALLWYRQRPGHALAWMLGGLWVLYGLIGHPLLNDFSSANALMERVDHRIGAEGELGMVAWKEQNLLQYERSAATFGFTKHWAEQRSAAAAWQAQSPRTRWLFVLEDALGPCVDRSRAEFEGIANRRRWWLVPGDAWKPGCIDDANAPNQLLTHDDEQGG